MKKMLFVLPILVVFSMAVMPVASADAEHDAILKAVQDPLGFQEFGVAGIVRTILDELRSAVANELHDPDYAATGLTVSGLSRKILDELRLYVQDPDTPSALEGGRSIGWIARNTMTELRLLQADVDSLQADVQQLQASVDEVIELLKTPQGRRSGWNQ